MKEPIYVLKTKEAVRMPKKGQRGQRYMRNAAWILIAVIILGSLFFGENLFMELSLPTRVLVVGFVLKGLVFAGEENKPSPIELQFYEDCLILYCPKRYDRKHEIRRTIDKMYYKDITKCLYKRKSKRLQIYGTVYATWYRYDKNDQLESTPFYERVVADTFAMFSTRCAEDVDFVAEIENHSPIKVTVEES